MQFRIYDILSNLVPGFIVYLACLKYSGKGYTFLSDVAAIGVAFVIGFFVNAISAWLAEILSWGGDPAHRMLEGKGTFRVSLLEPDKVKEKLKRDFAFEDKEDLFKGAERFVNTYKDEKNSRVFELFESYVFSRSLFVSVIISAVLVCAYYFNTNYFYIALVISILLVLINWYRCKERRYYYVKEVLDFYYINK